MIAKLIIELLALLPSLVTEIEAATEAVHKSPNGPEKVKAALAGVSVIASTLSKPEYNE